MSNQHVDVLRSLLDAIGVAGATISDVQNLVTAAHGFLTEVENAIAALEAPAPPAAAVEPTPAPDASPFSLAPETPPTQ